MTLLVMLFDLVNGVVSAVYTLMVVYLRVFVAII